MIQDSRGNVWIATGGGLSRFNGYDFINYTTRHGLNYSRIQCVAEDYNKNIWIGSSKGINVFNGQNILSFSDSLTGLNILALEPAGDKGMWILTESGLCIASLINDKIRVRLLSVHLGQYNKTNIFQQRDLSNFILHTNENETYIGFSGNLFHLKNNKVTQIVLPANMLVFSACELRKHEILIGTNNGLFQISRNKLKPLSQKNLKNTTIFKITANNNKIWIIARHNEQEETWLGTVKLTSEDYFKKIGKKNGLINPPTSLFIDHENNVWCSSYGGLSILRGESFISYNKKNGLASNKIWAIASESPDKIWVGSIGEGLSLITSDTIIRNYYLSDGLPDMSTGHIFIETNRKAFIGTATKGLFEAEKNEITGKLNFSQVKCSMNSGITRIDDIIRDKDGIMWIASSKGLYYSNTSGSYIHYPLFNGDTGQVFVQKLLFSSKEKLWVVTKSHGLYFFENGKFNHFNPGFFNNVTLSSITEDCAHHIWLGSQSHGIVDISEKNLHWINDKDGLISNLVYILIADKHCNLWIGTNIGLDKLVLDDYHKVHKLDIRHYDINEGMQSLEMNLNGAVIDEKDNIWFASNNGLLKYNYLEDIINNTPPISNITDVSLFSQPVDWSVYSDSLNIWNNLPINPVMPYNQNHITFQFVGISFRNPKKIQYSWILEGFESKWTPPNANRSAIYSSLPPGNYNFRLRSSNNEGLWTQNEVTFPFVITPPFWATWWFRIPVIIIILLILYFSYRLRTYSLRRSKIDLEKQVKDRTTEIMKQKEKIESIHHVVNQSIEYARQIQNSTLPSETILKKAFSDHFILYMPRDKVSGDFYWWTKMKLDNIYVIAVADCTGHGVPGAFMSMLGMTMLNEIVNKEYFFHPPVILRKLRKDIISSLKQSDEFGEVKDGMDMAIMSIDIDKMELQFSGANNPLYIISAEENRFSDVEGIRKYSANNMFLYEFLPDKMPISIFDRMNKFKGYEVNIKKDDQLYIFSDGYPDQFGGNKGKKFMNKAFKFLLLDICNKEMAEQKLSLAEFIIKWKGNLDQVDDITVLGLKI